MRIRMGGYTISMVTVWYRRAHQTIHRETQRQAQKQVFIEQQECCENATKRAALQLVKL